MNEEYIKKQAVLERLRPFDHKHADLEHGNEHFINGVETTIEVIEDTPAADVVEVVRCRECRFSEEVNPGLYICHNEDIIIVGSYADPDWYCAAGKRKETKDNDRRNGN